MAGGFPWQAVLGGTFLVVIFGFNVLSLIYDVTAEADGLHLVLFRRFHAAVFPYDNIEKVIAKSSFCQGTFVWGAMNMTNRFFAGKYLVILKESGIARALLVSPGDEAFARTLQRHGIEIVAS